MKDKLRVLICGTTFGQIYLNGISQYSEDYVVKGILSTGSEQSKKCASYFNVSLYTDIKEIDKTDFDVACVVVRSSIVGGNGTTLVKQLLEKGIHVIQEQPVHYQDVADCLKLAKANHCQYIVNTFYPYIESIKQFIELAQRLLQETKPVYIEAACSLQVLYPLLDILGQAVGGFTPWHIDQSAILKNGIFTIVTGKIKNIPIELRIQNQINPNNPDNYFRLLHKVSLYTDSGTLHLTDSNGCVLWNPRIYIPNDMSGALDLYSDERFLKLPVSEKVVDIKDATYQDVYEHIWPKGIATALDIFKEDIRANRINAKYLQNLLSLCQIWNVLGQTIGYSEEIDSEDIMPITLNYLNGQTDGGIYEY